MKKCEVSFYHLLRTPLEYVLPRLLERVLASGKRALVLAGSLERVDQLAAHLWSYDQNSFLPHGTTDDGYAGYQPIWIDTTSNMVAPAPNGATILLLTDGADLPVLDHFERCLDIFDGNDPVELAAARERYLLAGASECHRRYFQQTETGWQDKVDVSRGN